MDPARYHPSDTFAAAASQQAGLGSLLVAALRRQWRIAAACTGGALLIAIAYLLITPALLETSVAVRVDVADMTQPGMESTATGLLSEQPQIMRSTPVIALGVVISKSRGLHLFPDQSNLIQYIKSNLLIRSTGQTNVYTVSLTTSRPTDAGQFLDALIAAYSQYQTTPRDVESALAATLAEQQRHAEAQRANLQGQLNVLLQNQMALSPTLASRQELAAQRAQLAASLSIAKPGEPRIDQARLDQIARAVQQSDALEDQATRLRAEMQRLADESEELSARRAHLEQSQANQLVISLNGLPQTNPTRVSPRRGAVIGSFLLGGLLLGIVAAVVVDRTRDALQDAADASAAAAMPLLGCVPAMPRTLSTLAQRGQCVLTAQSDPSARAWREVRSQIESHLVSHLDKTILVTSPGSGHGKSVAACNLAIAMAAAGKRVALVDAHHHLPMVNRIFAIDDCVGLDGAIQGTVNIQTALHVTALRGLEVLPTGSSAADWSELLNRPEFLEVLTELSDRFDRVIIDGGPASLDETRIISAFCDVTVLVVDGRRCRRRDLRAVARGLGDVGARMVGLVFNEVPARRGGFAATPQPTRSPRRFRLGRLTAAARSQLVETV